MKYYCTNCGAEYTDGMYTPTKCYLCDEEPDLIEVPVYETVEQWEERTDEIYPSTAPVYALQNNLTGTHWYLHCASDVNEKHTIVATEAGAPPDDWRPV